MNIFWWILVVIGGILLIVLVPTIIWMIKGFRQPDFFENEIKKSQEQVKINDRRIAQGDKRIEQNEDRIKQNNEWVEICRKQMEEDKEFMAKNDKSMRDIAQLKLLIPQGVFSAEEIAIIENLAINPVFDEFASRTTTTAYNENSRTVESDTRLTKQRTKVLLSLRSSEKTDIQLAELDEQIQENGKKIKEQEKEILKLRAHAAELHPEMERVDAEIAKWLAIGQSRV